MSATDANPGQVRVLGIRKSYLSLVSVRRSSDDLTFLPAALEIIETPASPAGRAIGSLIVAAAVTSVVWACFSKIDIITEAPGRIIPIGRSKIVQPFQEGIVQSILVNDGDHVEAGQPLIVLDSTAAKADAFRIAQELLNAELDRSRLEGLKAVLGTDIPPSLLDLPRTVTTEQVDAAGVQMRAQALEQASKLADLEQQIAEKESEVREAEATIAKVQIDKPFLRQVATMRTQLYEDAVGSKLDWLSAEQQLEETGPDIALAQAQKGSAQSNVLALRQAYMETEAEYSMRVSDDLQQANEKVAEATQDLVKANQLVLLSTLRAPIFGTIQQLVVHTIGGIVDPAQALLTVVPENQQLIVEANIKNQDIGFVRVGQDAQVKVGAYDFTRFGAIKGKVVSISHDVIDQEPNQSPADDGYTSGADGAAQDSLTEATNGSSATAPQEPEYVAHIALSRTTIDTDQGVSDLQPGMAVTADIETGRRTVISYLLSPFTHNVEEAGRER